MCVTPIAASLEFMSIDVSNPADRRHYLEGNCEAFGTTRRLPVEGFMSAGTGAEWWCSERQGSALARGVA